jgi:hypothetical protein
VLCVYSGASKVVGIVQGSKLLGGGPGHNLAFPPLLLAWVGAGGAGVDRGEAKEHGDSAGASQHSAAPVKLIQFGFASASVRQNARKNSKFEFSKFSTLGAHHIG